MPGTDHEDEVEPEEGLDEQPNGVHRDQQPEPFDEDEDEIPVVEEDPATRFREFKGRQLRMIGLGTSSFHPLRNNLKMTALMKRYYHRHWITCPIWRVAVLGWSSVIMAFVLAYGNGCLCRDGTFYCVQIALMADYSRRNDFSSPCNRGLYNSFKAMFISCRGIQIPPDGNRKVDV